MYIFVFTCQFATMAHLYWQYRVHMCWASHIPQSWCLPTYLFYFRQRGMNSPATYISVHIYMNIEHYNRKKWTKKDTKNHMQTPPTALYMHVYHNNMHIHSLWCFLHGMAMCRFLAMIYKIVELLRLCGWRVVILWPTPPWLKASSTFTLYIYVHTYVACLPLV